MVDKYARYVDPHGRRSRWLGFYAPEGRGTEHVNFLMRSAGGREGPRRLEIHGLVLEGGD